MEKSSGQADTSILSPQRRRVVKEPPLYRVIVLNDERTPMNFVVKVLEHVFGMERQIAVRLMLHVHHNGSGVCGVYIRDLAETYASRVEEYARRHEHPLRCKIEPVS